MRTLETLMAGIPNRMPSAPESRPSRWLLGCLTALSLGLAVPALRAQDVEEPASEEPEILGAAAAFNLIDEERERIWLPAGSPLFERPDVASDRLLTIDALCEIEVLERSGVWYRVHFGDRSGWVRPDLPDDLRAPELVIHEPMSAPAPNAEGNDPARRRRLALEALGLSEPNGRLGPWELMTDVSDSRLIGQLDRIASRLTTSYSERYGVEPADAARQAVAVFSTEEAYRPFEAEATYLSDLGARGHAGDSLAALFIEGQKTDEVQILLVHELTHLMGRAVLGSTAPPWLDEGMANDIAFSRISRDGTLRPGSLNGDRVRMGNASNGVSFTYTGGFAALAERLRLRATRQATPLPELVALDQKAFLDKRRHKQHYLESTFFVRFLLDAERGRYAAGFRDYLASMREGEAPTLPEALGTDWKHLQKGLDAWLDTQAVTLLR